MHYLQRSTQSLHLEVSHPDDSPERCLLLLQRAADMPFDEIQDLMKQEAAYDCTEYMQVLHRDPETEAAVVILRNIMLTGA